MKFETWLAPSSVPPTGGPPTGGPPTGGPPSIGVVIDVLRATSVAATVMAAGARRLLTCGEIDRAFELRNQHADDRLLLCGERHCNKIDGFDFGNSPSEFSPAAVSGRDLVMTTTNGTRAIDASSDCETLVLAAFVNLSAVAEMLVARDRQSPGVIRLVCAGTDGKATMEDVLLAGALLATCHRKLSDSSQFYGGPIELLDDAGAIALAAWQHSVTNESVSDAASLADRFSRTAGGRNLIATGHAGDLIDCASIDVFDIVPVREQGNAFFSIGAVV